MICIKLFSGSAAIHGGNFAGHGIGACQAVLKFKCNGRLVHAQSFKHDYVMETLQVDSRQMTAMADAAARPPPTLKGMVLSSHWRGDCWRDWL